MTESLYLDEAKTTMSLGLRYFLAMWFRSSHADFMQWHCAQKALYGWAYILGVRYLRKNGNKRYLERSN